MNDQSPSSLTVAAAAEKEVEKEKRNKQQQQKSESSDQSKHQHQTNQTFDHNSYHPSTEQQTIELDITSKDQNLNDHHQNHLRKHQPNQIQDECSIEQTQQSEETLRQPQNTLEHQQEHQKITSTTANPNPEPEQRQDQSNENQCIGTDPENSTTTTTTTTPQIIQQQSTQPHPRTTEDIQAQPNFNSLNPNQSSTDERWFIKPILWPPFPTRSPKPRSVSIVMQNSNGPCSLLAISNILLLRGSISLPGPSDRSSISFSTLSSILANYLIALNQANILDSDKLQSALSVIPITRTGLDLNPRFGSIDGFCSDSDGRLDLFSSVGIDLVHGWVADFQDLETWEVIVGKCGDYDQAVDLMVAAQELTQSESSDDLIEEDLLKINDASLVKKFLESTPTQLSYSGLFQLASGLNPDSLAALFRNSHLSVVYRRPSLPLPVLPQTEGLNSVQGLVERTEELNLNNDQSSLPKLFTLVTDLSFLNEEQIIWESLEDLEGGLSEFYDWKLNRAQVNTAHNRDPIHSESRLGAAQADFDLANQLRREEYRLAAVESEQQQQQQQRPFKQPPPRMNYPAANANITAMAVEAQPPPPPSQNHHQVGTSTPARTKPRTSDSMSNKPLKHKKGCILM